MKKECGFSLCVSAVVADNSADWNCVTFIVTYHHYWYGKKKSESFGLP